jgi:phage shock protein A
MGMGTILALVISGLVLIYTIFRDNTKDTNDLLSRVSDIETTIAVQDSNITRLSDEQDKMKETLRNLEIQIHELDIKLERIITILEQSKVTKKG